MKVGGDKQGRVAVPLQPRRQLASERCFTRTLESEEHDHGRRSLGEAKATRFASEDGDEFVVDDLDYLLRRIEGA